MTSAPTAATDVTARSDRLLAVISAIQRWLLPVLLVTEIVLFSILSPHFLTQANLINIAINAADLALVAAGLTLIILMGGIDVSTGFAVGLITWIVATTLGQGLPPLVVLSLAIASGIVLGLVNGVLTVRLSIPSIVATLGTSAIFQTALFALWNSQDVFSGPVTPWLSGQAAVGPMPVFVLLVLGVYLLLHVVLTRTVFGRSVFAVGSNPEAARLAGIDIGRVRITAYVILGALIGVAACAYLARIGVVQATTGNELTMLAIASVVVGGTSILGGEGSMLRTLAGLAFIAILRNGIVLAGVPSLWNGVFIGLVILLAVGINGLAGVITARQQRSLA